MIDSSANRTSGTSPTELPLFIDSDNALESPFGDVDDGFAIAAILKSGRPVEALASVFGNTFEPWVFKSHQALARECGFSGTILRGAATWWTRHSEAADYLAGIDHPIRIVAIGPMTDIALALRKNPALERNVREIIFVGMNRLLPLPAWRIFDFNQWKDPEAMRRVFASKIPLTCIPCDVARAMRVTFEKVEALPGRVGRYLPGHSERWFKRSRLFKGIESVPLWDLTAAMYAIEPNLFTTTETTAELTRAGQAVYGGVGSRAIRLVSEFDANRVWKHFNELLQASREQEVSQTRTSGHELLTASPLRG